ncbi:copper chaperone PCu(A)C [Campylobacter majalis]|uniref:copper chaperone PCu(A)C n=1 Tax=Campylobacter majalis TaxID=2790656 RepID=UPI003D6919A0
MKKILLLIFALIFSFGSELNISNIYARIAPNGINGAIFMDITNNLNANIKLINAKSNISKSVEIHTHAVINGMKMMTKIDAIEIPMNQTTSLKPGSYHIMLMGLNADITPETEFSVTLEFDTGKSITLDGIMLNNGAKRLFLEP